MRPLAPLTGNPVPGLTLFALLSLTSPATPIHAAAPEPETHSVADFGARPLAGPVTLVGYVTSAYLCPPCPPGAQCKPCVGDHVTLADAHRPAESPAGGTPDLVVFAERGDIAALEVGRRYRIRVEARPGNVRLTRAERID